MAEPNPIIKFLLLREENEDELERDLMKDVQPDDSDLEQPPPEPPDPESFDKWVEAYRPVQNQISGEGENGPFDGTLFETYGAELDFVRAQDINKVWTYVSGDNNEDIIVAGYHWVNRNGYFVTEVPWTDDAFYLQF